MVPVRSIGVVAKPRKQRSTRSQRLQHRIEKTSIAQIDQTGAEAALPPTNEKRNPLVNLQLIFVRNRIWAWDAAYDYDPNERDIRAHLNLLSEGPHIM